MQTIKQYGKTLAAACLALAMAFALLPVGAIATADPTIRVSSETAPAGGTVDVTVALENNPGVISALLEVSYDQTVLTLASVTDGGILGTTYHNANLAKYPYVLSWANDTASENITANGTIVTLTFQVAANAPEGEYPITVSYDPDNAEIINLDFETPEFTVVAGGVTVEGALAELKISGASLTLTDNIAINYKVAKNLFAENGGDYENPYMVFTMNDVETRVDAYYEADGRYVFDFTDIAPQKMNDTVTATLYATNNGHLYASTPRDYSVATYCYNMLGKATGAAYATLRTLLVDLLNYGAAAQTYVGYRTDALVNANLTAAQRAYGTSADPTLGTVLNTAYATVASPEATWKGAGLYLQDTVAIRLKVQAADLTGMSARVRSESGGEWTIPASKFVSTDGGYFVYFNGLNAAQMRESVYCTVYRGETPVSNTVRYSICSYAYAQSGKDLPALNALLKAMMKYGDAAYAYAHG